MECCKCDGFVFVRSFIKIVIVLTPLLIVDMTRPVHRHLMEQKWRNDGGLDLLVRFLCSSLVVLLTWYTLLLTEMERIHQMKVVPDVLPILHPSIDLHVTAKNTAPVFHQTKKIESEVEPGVHLTPAQVCSHRAVVLESADHISDTLSSKNLCQCIPRGYKAIHDAPC